MITIIPNQNLTASSGLINMGHLASIYHSMMDEALTDLGRPIIFHLQPAIASDSATNSENQSRQYNPFFGRSPIPSPTTKNAGVRITNRDVTYTGHIVVGPKSGPDTQGIGSLKENQCSITVVIGALQHLKEARSFSIEGRRYSLVETRPIGFVDRKYVIAILQEIQESDTQEDIGDNG